MRRAPGLRLCDQLEARGTASNAVPSATHGGTGLMTDVHQAADQSDRVTRSADGKSHRSTRGALLQGPERASPPDRRRAGEAAVDRRSSSRNVVGQRYIATDLDRPVELEIHGTPGNDLAAFMNGQTVVVHGNAQDGVGNTMNAGEVVVHGHAGDILGMSMRGGIDLRPRLRRLPSRHPHEGVRGPDPGAGDRRDGAGLPRRVHGRRADRRLRARPATRARRTTPTSSAPACTTARSTCAAGFEDHQLGREVGVVRPGERLWRSADTDFLRKCAEGTSAHFGGDVDGDPRGRLRQALRQVPSAVRPAVLLAELAAASPLRGDERRRLMRERDSDAKRGDLGERCCPARGDGSVLCSAVADASVLALRPAVRYHRAG